MSAILNLDDRVLRAANSVIGHIKWLDSLVAFLAVYLVYLVPVILLALWFYSKQSKKVAIRAFASGMLAWPTLTYIISHYVWYRARPFVADIGLKEVIFHRPDYSFPSDHVTLLAALAASLWMSGYRKLSWWLIVITVITGIGRVMVGVHYPLDILSGIALGLLAALIVKWFDGWLAAYLYNPIIKIMTKFKLA